MFLLSLFVGAVLFVWTVKQIGWQAISSSLFELPIPSLLLIVAATLLMLFFGTLRWREVLRSQKKEVSILPLFVAYLGGFSLSFLTPMAIFGGEAFRAYAAAEQTDTPFSQTFASVVVERVLEILTYAVVVIAGITFFFFYAGTPPIFLFWILGVAVFLLGAVGFLFFKEKSVLRGLFQLKGRNGALDTEREVLRFFRFSNPFLWSSLFFSVGKSCAALLRTWMLISFLGASPGILQALGITSFYYASLFIPIPASLGLHEVFQAFAFGMIGSSSTVGVAFALITRIAELSVALLGLLFLAHFGLGMLVRKMVVKVARMFEK